MAGLCRMVSVPPSFKASGVSVHRGLAPITKRTYQSACTSVFGWALERSTAVADSGYVLTMVTELRMSWFRQPGKCLQISEVLWDRLVPLRQWCLGAQLIRKKPKDSGSVWLRIGYLA